MAYQQCEISVIRPWCHSSHPLHLVADKVKWMTFAGRTESKIIALNLHGRNVISEEDHLFCVVELKDCPSQDNPPEDSLCFSCSEEFADHYGLHLPSNPIFSFMCISPFSLDKVVLAALTEETYQWTNDQKFETGVLVSSACNNSMLVRQNDFFLAPLHHMFSEDKKDLLQKFRELVVVDCGPLRQGIISSKTAISIVRFQDDRTAEEFNSESLSLQVFYPASKNSPSYFDDLKHSSLLSHIFCSESLSKTLSLCMDDTVKITLKDADQTVISTRLCFLKVVEDSKFCSHNSRNTFHINRGNSRKLPSQKRNHAVQLSSSLWFNMTHSAGRTLSKDDIQIDLTKCDDNIVFADEIHLSLVQSPSYSASGQFDKTLVKFLSNCQLLTIGDVIPINVSGDMDFYNQADEKTAKCSTLYYKVMQFGGNTESKCYKVDSVHTSLYQDGITNSFVPNPKWSCTQGSTGLDKYVEKFQNVLKPYLQETCDLSHNCTLLVTGQAGSGKTSIITEGSAGLNLHVVQIDCLALVGDTSGATEAKIKDAFRKASTFSPCVLLLDGLNYLGKNRETGQVENRVCLALTNAIDDLASDSVGSDGRFAVTVVATAPDKTSVVAEFRSLFLHQIDIEAPSEQERCVMAKHATSSMTLSRDLDFQWIAKHTAGFIFSDFWELARQATQVCHDDVIAKCAVGTKLSWKEEQCVCMSGINTCHQDFVQALRQLQAERADSIGVPEIPDVKWDDIGGLEEVKSHILDTIQLPLDHPQLVAAGLRRSGVLLYGPPGTGKTLLAKAVASQCALSFLSVKGPELINMYIGQSEENVRRVFQRARDAAPCVIFFDELDALAPNRGRSGDSGGVMDRVVSQLLAELDGVNGAEDLDKQVFVIAASNRPDLIDSALLRPGRLDKLLYVGISESRSDQLKVLTAQTKRLNLSPEVRLEEVVQLCPSNMTGADFYALTCDAAMSAVRRRIGELEAGRKVASECCVEQKDLVLAAKTVVPSVDAGQLENYKRVKAEMAR